MILVFFLILVIEPYICLTNTIFDLTIIIGIYLFISEHRCLILNFWKRKLFVNVLGIKMWNFEIVILFYFSDFYLFLIQFIVSFFWVHIIWVHPLVQLSITLSSSTTWEVFTKTSIIFKDNYRSLSVWYLHVWFHFHHVMPIHDHFQVPNLAKKLY
jgi:hypothetical protein